MWMWSSELDNKCPLVVNASILFGLFSWRNKHFNPLKSMKQTVSEFESLISLHLQSLAMVIRQLGCFHVSYQQSHMFTPKVPYASLQWQEAFIHACFYHKACPGFRFFYKIFRLKRLFLLILAIVNKLRERGTCIRDRSLAASPREYSAKCNTLSQSLITQTALSERSTQRTHTRSTSHILANLQPIDATN